MPQGIVPNGFDEVVPVHDSVRRIEGEEPGEEHDLARKEGPHAEPSGMALLQELLELLGQHDSTHAAPPGAGIRKARHRSPVFLRSYESAAAKKSSTRARSSPRGSVPCVRHGPRR